MSSSINHFMSYLPFFCAYQPCYLLHLRSDLARSPSLERAFHAFIEFGCPDQNRFQFFIHFRFHFHVRFGSGDKFWIIALLQKDSTACTAVVVAVKLWKNILLFTWSIKLCCLNKILVLTTTLHRWCWRVHKVFNLKATAIESKPVR